MEQEGDSAEVSNEEIVTLIKKNQKSSEDLKRMDLYFSKVKFFQDCKTVLTNEQYHRILRSIEFEKLAKNQILFHKGERGNKFYVLLSGAAAVIVPRIDFSSFKIPKPYVKFINKVLYERIAEPRLSLIMDPSFRPQNLENVPSMLRRGATMVIADEQSSPLRKLARSNTMVKDKMKLLNPKLEEEQAEMEQNMMLDLQLTQKLIEFRLAKDKP